jgi:hypothetical protein
VESVGTVIFSREYTSEDIIVNKIELSLSICAARFGELSVLISVFFASNSIVSSKNVFSVNVKGSSNSLNLFFERLKVTLIE